MAVYTLAYCHSQLVLDSVLGTIELHLGRNTGEFMMSRYREVAEIVLRYLEHRDRLVRLSITQLLPRIAHFLRDRFVTNYLTVCLPQFISLPNQL